MKTSFYKMTTQHPHVKIESSVRLALSESDIPFYLQQEIVKIAISDWESDLKIQLDFSDGNFRYMSNKSLFLNDLPPYSSDGARERLLVQDRLLIDSLRNHNDFDAKSLVELAYYYNRGKNYYHVPFKVTIPFTFTQSAIINRNQDFATHFTIPDPDHVINTVGIFIKGLSHDDIVASDDLLIPDNLIELFEYNQTTRQHELRSFKPPYSPWNSAGTPYAYCIVKILDPDTHNRGFNLNFIGYQMVAHTRSELRRQSDSGIDLQLYNKQMRILHMGNIITLS